ncbi:MAG: hypothetical protein Q9M34_11475 [Sulfurimonas sp.]|nr:hypothetical protein [Sulfurimonas sp.]
MGIGISFTPMGVGLNFSVGEILDPFNDMVERFSWVMLTATVSLGVQKIILTLSGTLFIQVSFALSVSLSLFLLWSKQLKLDLAGSFIFKSFLILLVLRFSTIVFIYLGWLMHTHVLKVEYDQASQVVQKTQVQLESLNKQNQNLVKQHEEDGFLSGLHSNYNAMLQTINIQGEIEALESSINEAGNNIINLITIFIVETILMPLLYFWFLVIGIKSIFRFEFGTHQEKLLYNK